MGVVGVILSFLAIELLLRVIEWTPAWKVLPVVERELGWPDPDLGYALRPSLEIINVRENRARPTTNSLGMRDRERVRIKLAADYRVILTGDSFTEALQVEDHETFAHLAELEVNAGRQTQQVELLNFGMSGAGPVQQLVRAQLSVQEFSADALVMVININQFLTEEMSNDSINPAYVEDANGALGLGYAFRQRRSQRLRDSIVGALFFVLMDHSRILRAAYLRYAQGAVPSVAGTQRADFRDVRSCTPLNQPLARQAELWQERSPTGAASRVTRFLNDVATLSKVTGVQSAIIFFGLGEPNAQCFDVAARRASLMSYIETILASQSIKMWDAENYISSELGGYETASELRGFGSYIGTGHLNRMGHQVYARLLSSVVNELMDAQ